MTKKEWKIYFYISFMQVDSNESIRGFKTKYAILLEILVFSKPLAYTTVVRELNSFPIVMNDEELNIGGCWDWQKMYSSSVLEGQEVFLQHLFSH